MAVSSYPSDITAANVSKDTTCRELIEIEGFEFNDVREHNINLFFGEVNSVDYCTNIFNLPDLKTLI